MKKPLLKTIGFVLALGINSFFVSYGIACLFDEIAHRIRMKKLNREAAKWSLEVENQILDEFGVSALTSDDDIYKSTIDSYIALNELMKAYKNDKELKSLFDSCERKINKIKSSYLKGGN